MTGLSNGSVTLKKVSTRRSPSMAAASYTYSGRLRKPAIRTIMTNGVHCQTSASIRAAIDQFGSGSQFCTGKCTNRSSTLSGPYLKFSM